MSGDDDVRARLEQARRAALERVAALRRRVADISETAALDPPDDEHDPEGATVAYERQLAATLLEDAVAAVAELDEAVARLEAGTYGACARCGERIPPARLVARPTARTCVACADAGRGSGAPHPAG